MQVSRRGDTWTVRGTPAWFGPVVRQAVALGVQTLAIRTLTDEYSYPPDFCTDILFERMRLIPLLSSGQQTSATIRLVESNTMHTCAISGVALVTLTITAETPADARKDPVLPQSSKTFRIDVRGDASALTIEAHPGGPWTLEAVDARAWRFVAQRPAAVQAANEWRAALGKEKPLQRLQSASWRFVEPDGAGPLRWVAAIPGPLKITARNLRAPPGILNAEFADVPLCTLRRGDCIRMTARAVLGTGADGAAHAPACFGAPAVTRKGPNEPWIIVIDPIGHLSSRETLARAAAAVVDALRRLLDAVDCCYEGPEIPRCHVAPPVSHHPPRARATTFVHYACGECEAVARFATGDTLACPTQGCPASKLMYKLRAPETVLELKAPISL